MWSNQTANAPFNPAPSFAPNQTFGVGAPQPTGFNSGFAANTGMSQPFSSTQPKPFGNQATSFSQGASLFNNPQNTT